MYQEGQEDRPSDWCQKRLEERVEFVGNQRQKGEEENDNDSFTVHAITAPRQLLHRAGLMQDFLPGWWLVSAGGVQLIAPSRRGFCSLLVIRYAHGVSASRDCGSLPDVAH